MPYSYPPLAPTLSGNLLTIDRFLRTPNLVERRFRDLTDQRFIADVILTGRYPAPSGSILYEQSESIFADRDVDAVAPGAEYPQTATSPGTPLKADITKWGQAVPITDEAIGRMRMSYVDRQLIKLSNTLVRRVDTTALAVIGAAVTQTQAAFAAWSAATADPLLDVTLASAQVSALDQGYETDTLVVRDALYARLVSNQKIIAGLARESTTTVTSTGDVMVIAGHVIRRTARMPVGWDAFVCDSTQLGGIAYEEIPSPGTPAPQMGGLR